MASRPRRSTARVRKRSGHARGPGRYDRALSTDQRSSARIEQILDAATEVFAVRGYAGTRVEDIVATTGISRRTLYTHFPSIDGLLEQIYERAVKASFTTVLQGLVSVRDPVARVHAGVASFFGLLAAHPSAARVVFDVFRHAGPAQAAKHELNTARWAQVMFDFLNACFAAGKLPRAPDEPTVFALAKGLEAVGVRALQRGEPETLHALAPSMSALLLAAFGGCATDHPPRR
jgi:AcrR family transcriptional regulator